MAKKNPWQIVTFVLIGVLVLGLITGFIVFGSSGNSNGTGQCYLSDIQSKEVNNGRIDYAIGYLQGTDCYDIQGVDSSWTCFLDDVDPIESSCTSSSTGCSTFNFKCRCFK